MDEFDDPQEYRRRIKIKAKMHKVLAEVEQEMQPVAAAAPHRSKWKLPKEVKAEFKKMEKDKRLTNRRSSENTPDESQKVTEASMKTSKKNSRLTSAEKNVLKEEVIDELHKS